MGDKPYEILTWFRAMTSAPKANSENPADKNSPELSEYKDIVNLPYASVTFDVGKRCNPTRNSKF